MHNSRPSSFPRIEDPYRYTPPHLRPPEIHLYDFKCRRCNTKFSTMVDLNKDKRIFCPKCVSEDIENVMRPSGLWDPANYSKL